MTPLRPSRARWLAVAAAAALVPRAARAAAAAPDVRDRPLIDHDGGRFTLRAIGGRAAAISFIATRCSDTCPISEALFYRLAGEIARRRLDARLVLVTLDPRADTPFVLSRVARALGARAPQFRLATADPPTIDALLYAFGVTVETDAAGIPDAHGALTYVLDRQGTPVRTVPLSSRMPAAVLAELRARVG